MPNSLNKTNFSLNKIPFEMAGNHFKGRLIPVMRLSGGVETANFPD